MLGSIPSLSTLILNFTVMTNREILAEYKQDLAQVESAIASARNRYELDDLLELKDNILDSIDCLEFTIYLESKI